MNALPRRSTRQRGIALLAFMTLIAMGAMWWLVTALKDPSNRTASQRAHNAKVLQNAKTALIGYVALKAATPGEKDPGSLPCPEAAAYVGDPNDEGKAAPNCSLPAVGRLPWRTLGIDKPLDAANEPLWYVVSPAWAKPNSTTNTQINSNTLGQITVDGAEAVAILIAPGRALSVPSSANCTARNQTRTVPSPAIDFRDYLECQNATPADQGFASSDATGPFNDQVLAVTAVDLLPSIEAAVAARFEREIAPIMRSAYSNSDAANPNPAWPSANPVLPFAAPFANPQTSKFEGDDARYRGLLPFVRGYTACSCVPAGNCECTPTACAAGNDCDPTFVRWTGADPTLSGSGIYSADCDLVNNSTEISCDFYIRVPLFSAPPGSVSFTLSNMTARRVGRSLRQLQPEAPMTGVLKSGRNLSAVLNADSTATITLTAEADTSDVAGGGLVNNALCGIGGLLGLFVGCKRDTITIPHTVLVDHPVLNDNHPTYGWFHRNRWHEVSYYAVAQPIAPDGSGTCVAPPGLASQVCLSVDYLPTSGKQRGIIVIAGRSLTNPAGRPNGTLSDWLEGENATSGGISASVYAVREPTLTINRTFNDRIAVIGQNP